MTYPSILPLRKVPEIFTHLRDYVVQEKIHGTSARIIVAEKGIRVSISGNHPGKRTFLADRPGLEENLFWLCGQHKIVFYGEYAGDGIVQKSIRYGPPDFYPFDVQIDGEMQRYEIVNEYCERAGLVMAPLLAEIQNNVERKTAMRIEDKEKLFEDLRTRPSRLAQIKGISDPDIHEGIVIKSNPLVNYGDGFFMAKFKSDSYREESGELDYASNTSLVYSFARKYVVEARIVNILSHLGPEKVDDARVLVGSISGTMRDMPHLTQWVMDDLAKEEQEELQSLKDSGFAERDIRQGVGRVLSELYSQMIQKDALTCFKAG